MTNVVVRCVRGSDSDALLQLAEQAGPGMTNLPADQNLLEKKIHRALASFSKAFEKREQELYFFVLEEQNPRQVVGCSAILATAGDEYPFYSYKVGYENLMSATLNVRKQASILYLLHDYTLATELCGLFLHPDFRKPHHGELLSRMRLMYIASFPERFSSLIIAEMRGVIDENGHSPFWDSLGQHFFDMSFADADHLTAQGDKQFIIDLMPRCPIYVPLLSTKAQSAIGQVHPAAQPAVSLLRSEGFAYEGYIDIFDGAATLQARTEQIHTLTHSRQATVSRIHALDNEGELCMIANQRADDFRVTYGKIKSEARDFIMVEPAIAQLLEIVQGDKVRCIPFPKKRVEQDNE